MRLRYTKRDGTEMQFELSERPITIGRSPEADVVILEEKVSRIHCGVRLWDGEFYIKDLKSRNGTFVNGQRVDVAKLKPGDTIRVGNCIFSFDKDPKRDTDMALQEMQEEMAQGKGYSTILQQIVGDIKEQPTQAAPPEPGAAPAAPQQPIPIKIKRAQK